MPKLAAILVILLLILGVFALPSYAQITDPTPRDPGFGKPDAEPRLPDGKSQRQAILKFDHKKTLEDVQALVTLSQSLQKDLEQGGENVLSLGGIRKTEEIEKLAKRIRARMRSY